MYPVKHPTNNKIFLAPAEWDQELDGKCVELHVTEGVFDGLHQIVSFWKPSPEEIEQIVAGKLIGLSIVGRTHPPVQIGVEK